MTTFITTWIEMFSESLHIFHFSLSVVPRHAHQHQQAPPNGTDHCPLHCNTHTIHVALLRSKPRLIIIICITIPLYIYRNQISLYFTSCQDMATVIVLYKVCFTLCVYKPNAIEFCRLKLRLPSKIACNCFDWYSSHTQIR